MATDKASIERARSMGFGLFTGGTDMGLPEKAYGKRIRRIETGDTS